VCRGRVCDLPVTTAKDLAAALGPDDDAGREAARGGGTPPRR
jgi:hypothetical protein